MYVTFIDSKKLNVYSDVENEYYIEYYNYGTIQ